MKTKSKVSIILVALVAAVTLTLNPPARAQAPAPAVAPKQVLAPTQDQRAALAAAQIEQQVNYTMANLAKVLTTGLPAQGSRPAISAADLKESLGQANVAKLQKLIDDFK